MKLIPHHQDDKHGTREYRSPDGTWRVVRTRRPGGSRNARSRWEVHERCEGRGAGWRHHAAFERRRAALVFLDTTAAAPGGQSVTTALARRREITHNLDETAPRSRSTASRRPAGSANGSGRRPAATSAATTNPTRRLAALLFGDDHPHCSAFCTGAGLFSASEINSSNSTSRSGANRDTSDRQRGTCSTAMISAFRFAGAFPGGYRVRLAGHEDVPALPAPRGGRASCPRPAPASRPRAAAGPRRASRTAPVAAHAPQAVPPKS